MFYAWESLVEKKKNGAQRPYGLGSVVRTATLIRQTQEHLARLGKLYER